MTRRAGPFTVSSGVMLTGPSPQHMLTSAYGSGGVSSVSHLSGGVGYHGASGVVNLTTAMPSGGVSINAGAGPNHQPATPRVQIMSTGPLLAAADRVDEWAAAAKAAGLTPAQIKALPMGSFVDWLALEAAKAAGEDTSGIPDPFSGAVSLGPPPAKEKPDEDDRDPA